MSSIGCNEVHDRSRVLQIEHEVGPARVGIELGVSARDLLELAARLVQRRNAGITAAGDVESCQVERDAEELVAQHARDELVDLVADLAGHAANDGASSLIVIQTVSTECQRVQEGLEEIHVVLNTIGAGLIHGFPQHRMAEAVNHMGELGKDCRVDVDRRLEDECIYVWLDLAGELLEDEMLVLHLGCEAGGLEQALSVPRETVGECLDGGGIRRIRQSGAFGQRIPEPLVEEGDIAGLDGPCLDLIHHVIVFGVEHVMDRGQAYILVTATVAGDIACIKKFVVVGGLVTPRVIAAAIADRFVAILRQHGTGRGLRRSRMSDVIEEGVTCTNRIGRRDRVCRAALHELIGILSFPAELVVSAKGDHHLRKAVFSAHELAVSVHDEQRNVRDVGIRQFDTQDIASLSLHVGPSCEPSFVTLEQPAGGDRLAIHQGILPHEKLFRCV